VPHSTVRFKFKTEISKQDAAEDELAEYFNATKMMLYAFSVSITSITHFAYSLNRHTVLLALGKCLPCGATFLTSL
jgi:hypothetical protein